MMVPLRLIRRGGDELGGRGGEVIDSDLMPGSVVARREGVWSTSLSPAHEIRREEFVGAKVTSKMLFVWPLIGLASALFFDRSDEEAEGGKTYPCRSSL